jgi:prepilin-type N-terminal cleavage/methylation domain-containing protein
MHRRSSRGFTLVELLVVIAIIGVLVALLLPAIQAAREAARGSQCANNCKQMGLGVLNFDSANGRFPAGSTAATTGIDSTNSSTWSVDILPFAEQRALHSLWQPTVDFSVDTSPGGVRNKKLRESFVSLYICPSDVDTNQLYSPESGQGTGVQWAPGSYRAVSGSSPGTSGEQYWDNPQANLAANQTALPDWTRGPLHALLKTTPAGSADRKLKPISTKNIPDGTSNTLLIGEYHTQTNPNNNTATSRRTLWCYAYTSYNQSSGIRRAWTIHTDYNACVPLDGGQHNCKRSWGALHSGGMMRFARCDGSVVAISPDVDINLFASLTTTQGEEQLAISLP